MITRTIREIAADQPVERAATLEEVRAERLSPDRVNALVFSGFAGDRVAHSGDWFLCVLDVFPCPAKVCAILTATANVSA